MGNSPAATAPVSSGLPLRPYSSPWDFKQPGLFWCCSNHVWQGREPLTQLFPRIPVADLVGAGPGATVTLVPVLVPGALLSRSYPLTMCFFQCPLYFLVSYLHKCWGTVGCSLCSSVDQLGVFLLVFLNFCLVFFILFV